MHQIPNERPLIRRPGPFSDRLLEQTPIAYKIGFCSRDVAIHDRFHQASEAAACPALADRFAAPFSVGGNLFYGAAKAEQVSTSNAPAPIAYPNASRRTASRSHIKQKNLHLSRYSKIFRENATETFFCNNKYPHPA
jgi:hypothetical protein